MIISYDFNNRQSVLRITARRKHLSQWITTDSANALFSFNSIKKSDNDLYTVCKWLMIRHTQWILMDSLELANSLSLHNNRAALCS